MPHASDLRWWCTSFSCRWQTKAVLHARGETDMLHLMVQAGGVSGKYVSVRQLWAVNSHIIAILDIRF